MAASLAGAFSLPSLSAAVQAASSPYRRPKVKITDIRTGEIMGKNRQIHVRVYTDQGIVGQGEAISPRTTSPGMTAAPPIRIGILMPLSITSFTAAG